MSLPLRATSTTVPGSLPFAVELLLGHSHLLGWNLRQAHTHERGRGRRPALILRPRLRPTDGSDEHESASERGAENCAIHCSSPYISFGAGILAHCPRGVLVVESRRKIQQSTVTEFFLRRLGLTADAQKRH